MKRILLVESDMIVAKLCADDFIHSGYQVEVTTNSKVAFSALPRFKPDVIVLAYFLKDVTAPQFLTDLREDPERGSLPVVVLAPSKSSANAEAARKAGAQRFISKEPGWDRALRTAIRELLNPKPAPAPEIVEASDAPAAPEVDPPKPVPAPPISPTPRDIPSTGTPMGDLKKISFALLKTEDIPQQIDFIEQLGRSGLDLVNALGADPAGLLFRLAKALTALLDDLMERPQNIGPSSMRTIFQTVQYLELLIAQEAERRLESIEGFSVLAVDDDSQIRTLVTRALATIELPVQTAKDPVEAIEFTKRRRWDLFILDVNMPKMSGFDLCAKLRAIPSYAKTPVVFLTGCNDIEHRLRFARSKADDFIAKPFLLPELNVKVLGHIIDARIEAAEEAKQDAGAFRGFKI